MSIISVNFNDDFIETVKIYAEKAKRSIPQQIEYWAELGKLVEENPDLPYEFIKNSFKASEEIQNNQFTKYKRDR